MPDLLDRLKAALADRYAIEQEVGSGGMATVYQARDLRHNRQVALKILKPDLAAAVGTERFLQEIRVTASLHHPHILSLFDSGETDGFLYYVMPFVEGESLRAKLVREKQLTIDDALDITETVAGALAYAHEQGVIHRDIKPENILLHRGEVLVADFGIALALQTAGGTRLTDTGFSLGTPHYMSPEQAGGEANLDGRSDTYSLGCVLFEMLVGEPPFSGPSVQAVLARHMTETPPSLRVVRAAVPEGVERAVQKALAKAPADRFKSTGGFGRALLAVESVRPSRLARRKWLVPTGAIAVLIVALVVASNWFGLGRMNRARPDPAIDERSSGGTQNGDSLGSRISAFPGELRLAVGATASILITAFDAKGDVVAHPSLEWKSSNPAIATVGTRSGVPNIGQVDGVRPGVAVIRVDHGTLWRAVLVTVGRIVGENLFDEDVEVAGRLLLNNENRGDLSATEDAAHREGELVDVWEFESVTQSRVLLRVNSLGFRPSLNIRGPGVETFLAVWRDVESCAEVTVTLAEGLYRVAVESAEPFQEGSYRLGVWSSDARPSVRGIHCAIAQVVR